MSILFILPENRKLTRTDAVITNIAEMMYVIGAIITTIKRMIAQQRTQIGTLNALGMKKRMWLSH